MGFGPLESLLHDETISEIAVYSPDRVEILQGNVSKITDIKFQDTGHLQYVIRNMALALGQPMPASDTVHLEGQSGQDKLHIAVTIPAEAPEKPLIILRRHNHDY
jgi:pilus assembly protein CpaF